MAALTGRGCAAHQAPRRARALDGRQRLAVAAVVVVLVLLSPAAVLASMEPPVRHTVAPGDTLGALAERYGSTVPAIVAANGLADADTIAVGQALVIPPAGAPLVPVEVRPGETVESLARRHGVSVAALRQVNGLAPDGRLVVGQDLLVPPPANQPSPALPPGPVLSIETSAAPARQGETVLVQVRASEPLSLSLSLGDQAVPLFAAAAQAGRPLTYWGLAAVHAFTEPGLYWLDLHWQSAADQGALRWPLSVVDAGFPSFDIVLPPDKGNLLNPELVRAENEKVAAVWAGASGQPLWKGRFRRPVDEIYVTSAPFGQRRSYNGGPANSFHTGQDFAAPEGQVIEAPAAGVVVLAEPLTVRGNAVIVDHGAGLYTGYWHLSRIDVVPGQPVQPGDPLGLVGTTGLSTGNHLHWEMRLHSIAVDPLQWLFTRYP